jgi:hypothetical protein
MAKVKIPKRVAGVKIPKKLRKKANKALKLAESPVVREVAAAALGAGAKSRADRGREPHEGTQVRGPAPPLAVEAERVAEAIRAAAADGIRRFLEGFEEGLRKVADELDEEPKRRGGANGSQGRAGAD